MNKLMKSCTEHAEGIERLILSLGGGSRKWNRVELRTADKTVSHKNGNHPTVKVTADMRARCASQFSLRAVAALSPTSMSGSSHRTLWKDRELLSAQFKNHFAQSLFDRTCRCLESTLLAPIQRTRQPLKNLYTRVLAPKLSQKQSPAPKKNDFIRRQLLPIFSVSVFVVVGFFRSVNSSQKINAFPVNFPRLVIASGFFGTVESENTLPRLTHIHTHPCERDREDDLDRAVVVLSAPPVALFRLKI